MPKPKPSEVIVHRIDMQPSLKETLDSYLVAQTLTNAVGAVGAIFAAVAAPLGAIIAAMVAKEGLEAVKDKFGDIMQDVTEPVADDISQAYADAFTYYQAVAKAIQNGQFPREDGLNLVMSPDWQTFLQEVNGGSDFEYGPKIVFDNLKGMWIHTAQMTSKFAQENPQLTGNYLPQEWNNQVVALMQSYYPVSKLKDDIIDDFKNRVEDVTYGWGPAGWILRKSGILD